MTHATNDHDRLMLAFTEPNRHGIIARPARGLASPQPAPEARV